MNNAKKLLRSDIRHHCEDAAYESGKDYFERGRMREFSIQNQGALFVQISASVKGSAPLPYRQNIRINWRQDLRSAEIDGECSCRVGYNCKHVAAVCLQ